MEPNIIKYQIYIIKPGDMNANFISPGTNIIILTCKGSNQNNEE